MNATAIPGRSIRSALLLLVLLAPLGFGAAPEWAWSTLAIAIALLLIGDAVGPMRSGDLAPPRWILAPTAIVITAAIWQAFVPWPAHPIRLGLAEELGPVQTGPALNPPAAQATLVRLATYAAVFWLTLRSWNGQTTASALISIVLATVGYSVYGLIAHALDFQSVLWLGATAYEGASGPFVARGAFGALCSLGMVIAAGSLLRPAPIPAWILAPLWLIIFIALIASQSRSAFAAGLVGHLVLFLLYWQQGWLSGVTALRAAALLVCAGGVAVSASGFDARLLDSWSDLQDRLKIWQTAWAAVQTRPWLGHGLGSFAAAFNLHGQEDFMRPVMTAHSVPLEWAVEAGLPATLAWYAILLGLGITCWKRAISATRNATAAICVAAISGIAIQNVVDFAAQVPAIALLTAFLLGLGLSRRANDDHPHASARSPAVAPRSSAPSAIPPRADLSRRIAEAPPLRYAAVPAAGKRVPGESMHEDRPERPATRCEVQPLPDQGRHQ